MPNKKNWYFSRSHSYVDLSNLFAGYGAILIEGDALINYIYEDKDIMLESKYELNKFIKSLIEAGFDKIFIVFFHNISKWTNKSSSSSLKLKQPLQKKMSDIYDNVYIFNDWNNNTWADFIENHHISFVLATDHEIYPNKESQFVFIYDICNNNNLQIALIDYLNLLNIKVKSFLIDSNRDYHSLRAIDFNVNDSNNQKLLNDKNLRNAESITILHNIENQELNDLIEINNNQTEKKIVSNGLPNAASPIRWELKIHYKKPSDTKNKNDNRDKQLYTRHMERYAESLDSSKNLHHKIITNFKSNDKSKEEKLGAKAKEIQEANEALKLKKKEEKEINYIRGLKIKCYTEIDESIKLIDIDKYTDSAKYTLLKLRIKWLQYESDNIYKKTNLFLFINQAIEIYKNFLTFEDAEKMLICLKNLGFHSTCENLKNKLVRYNTNFELLKKILITTDSFDHDVFFQLNYCGDKLKRTLDSNNDSRVKFQPDKWQRDLLDAVDRNESSLICILIRHNIIFN
jgi:hypothetical protein